MSTITELRSSNVKRLTAVAITPPASGAIVIGGKNGQGKSSCLDSILYALDGKGAMPKQPVRVGAESAEIIVTISTNPPLQVTRKIKPDGKTTLEIKQKSADGIESKVSSPQKVLDSLVGTIAFDPLEFTRQKPGDQVKTLQDLVGVDTAEIDKQIADAMDFRKEKKADLATFEAVTKQMPIHADVAPNAEPLSLESVQEELKAAQENNKKIEDLGTEIGNIKASVLRWEQRVADLRKQLEEAEGCLRDEQVSLKQATEEHAALTPIDTAPIVRKGADIGTHNQKIKENAAYRKRVEEETAMVKAIDEMTAEIEKLRADRIKLMSAAEWPVDGLGFDANGVTFNGLPFTQCSSAEQLRISTAIGLAQNPKLKLMLIRDGSLLDEDNLAFLHELAIENDAQVWIERVSRGEECSLIIEEGAVMKPKELAASA